jgi:putative oxidoreductase
VPGRQSPERGTQATPFEGVEPQREFNILELGCLLQRLFSTFPNSWPGIGLLLVRLCLAVALLYFAMAPLSNASTTGVFVEKSIAAAGAIFLFAGLWTPVMGTVVAVDQVCMALSSHSLAREDAWNHSFLAVLAVSLAMLGPGAWSIDARLFGRKRFDIDPTRSKKHV